MRVIFTARQSLATTAYDRTLQRLVGILGVTSKNPSNPNFDQYLFESLSGLTRQVKWQKNGRFRHSLVCADLSLQQTQQQSPLLKGNCLGHSLLYSSKILTVGDDLFLS